MNQSISVTILTKNSQKYLPQVLAALSDFDEILIFDTGSTDATLDIAKRFKNVTIYEEPFIGFGPTHNKASKLAKHDWIFSIDSDEILTPELLKEISLLTLKRGQVYSCPRKNFYKGVWVKWCGWHPDRQIRLYNRLDTQFTEAQVHESVLSNGLKKLHLKHSLRHYPYECTSDFLKKMEAYSTLFALQNKGIKKSSLSKAIAHGLFSFFKSYILKKGFMGGQVGFEISFYNANTAFYKYLKLSELNDSCTLERFQTLGYFEI